MRFHYGETTAGATFKPEAGWTLLRKSGSMWRTQLAALPVGAAAAWATLAAWLEFAPPEISGPRLWLAGTLAAGVDILFHAAPWAANGVLAVAAGSALALLLFASLLLALALPLAVYFLAHELVHVLAAPSFGLTDRSVIGLWPAGGVAYSHYDGEMSRGRWLAVLLMPFLALSVLPLGVAAVSGWNSPYLAALSLVNAVGSYVDLYNAGYILFKVPAGACVRLADDGLFFRRG